MIQEDQSIHSTESPFATTEYLLSGQSIRFHLIYWVLLGSFIGGTLLLPFTLVVVTIKSPGILRPETAISQLKATSSGIVKEVMVKENDEVKKGQMMFSIRSPMLDEKESFLIEKLVQINRELEDLDRLMIPEGLNTGTMPELITPLYRQSFMEFLQKLNDRQFRFQKASQDYERNKKLFSELVIAKAEFENCEFELDKAKSELGILTQYQRNDWQKDLTNHERDAANCQSQLSETQREKENLNVIAPVSGSVQNLSGIYPGSAVFPNQDLGQISPTTDLIAEIDVSPNDIGMLREGMPVRIRIMAFDYNQWGLITGKIKEISRDIQFKNNEPIYEVTCSLNTEFLTLKNGNQGKLKKGMTVQARFSVIERSLWQLLYDRVDDWTNPGL